MLAAGRDEPTLRSEPGPGRACPDRPLPPQLPAPPDSGCGHRPRPPPAMRRHLAAPAAPGGRPAPGKGRDGQGVRPTSGELCAQPARSPRPPPSRKKAAAAAAFRCAPPGAGVRSGSHKVSAAGRAGGRRRLRGVRSRAPQGRAGLGFLRRGSGAASRPGETKPRAPLLPAEACGAEVRAGRSRAAPPRGPGRGENGRAGAAAWLGPGQERGRRPPPTGPRLPTERGVGSSASPRPCCRGACKPSQTFAVGDALAPAEVCGC